VYTGVHTIPKYNPRTPMSIVVRWELPVELTGRRKGALDRNYSRSNRTGQVYPHSPFLVFASRTSKMLSLSLSPSLWLLGVPGWGWKKWCISCNILSIRNCTDDWLLPSSEARLSLTPDSRIYALCPKTNPKSIKGIVSRTYRISCAMCHIE